MQARNVIENRTATVLLVDDEAPVVQALAVRCEQMGLQVRKAYNATEAMKAMLDSVLRPQLVLLDYELPGPDGLTFCEMLKADVTLEPVPVILLTGHDNQDMRRRCRELGVHFVRKDVNAWSVLQPMIRRVLGMESEAPPYSPAPYLRSAQRHANGRQRGQKVLVIDDDPAIAKGLKVRLEAGGMEVFAAYTGMQGYWIALKEVPGVVVLDYKMPEGWGNTILGKLKSNPITREIPVIILSGMTDLGVQRDVVRLGAECWVNKPFDMKAFVELIQETLKYAD